VVVIPQDMTMDVLVAAEDIFEREKGMRAELRRGVSVTDAYAKYGSLYGRPLGVICTVCAPDSMASAAAAPPCHGRGRQVVGSAKRAALAGAVQGTRLEEVMKKTSMGALILLAGSAIALTAQNVGTANTQAMGRGRGGAPYAWNDKNKDGVCDLTGRPVGQGRGAAMAGPGMGRGRGGALYAWNDKDNDGICDITGQPIGQGRAAAGARGRGAGLGFGRGFAARQQAQASATQK